MRARKVDANLSDIVNTARALGFLVYVRNDEFGDLDLQFAGKHYVVEVKRPKGGRYTEGQKRLRAEGWVILTMCTVEEVVAFRATLFAGKQSQ